MLFKTSKRNVPVASIKEKELEVKTHVIKCKMSVEGPTVMVSDKDIRPARKGQLTEDLLQKSSEETLEDYGQKSTVQANKYAEETEEPSGEEMRIPADTPQDEEEETIDPCIEIPLPPGNIINTQDTTGKMLYDIFGSDNEDEYFADSTRQRMLSGNGIGDPESDIGVEIQNEPDNGYTLESDEQKLLEGMNRVIGIEQVTKRRLGLAPNLIIEKSMNMEVKDNW